MKIIRQLLQSKELLEKGRLQENFFRRNRVFSFQKVILFIINLIRKSLQIELLNFAKMGHIKEASKQAFSKARRKLDPIIFTIMNQKLAQEFYTENEIKHFKELRLLAIDGSKVQLPSSDELIEYYGVGSNKTMPIAVISTLFDVLNKVTISGFICPHNASERSLAVEHIKNLITLDSDIRFENNAIKDLFILDRGYPSVYLIMFLHEIKKDFLMRCQSNFASDVQNAVKNGKKDQIIDIKISNLGNTAKRKLREKIPNLDESIKLRIRVLTFKLKSGEQEILLTSLLNKTKHSSNDIFKLYNKRWDTEENYKFQKSIASMENFSGKSKLTVEQDFFATIFTCNVAALLMQEAQDEINEVLEKKKHKYKYKINRNIGLGLLKNDLIETLLLGKNLDKFCQRVKTYMQKNIVPIRPGRSFSRHRSNSIGRIHPMNRRSSM
ncbi:IS4 family transposase [Candidatus Dependentiae bacterium]